MRRIVTIMITAAMLASAVCIVSGCQEKHQSPEDTYTPIVRTNDVPSSEEEKEEIYSSSEETSGESDHPESKEESKPESKTESKAESKAESRSSGTTSPSTAQVWAFR